MRINPIHIIMPFRTNIANLGIALFAFIFLYNCSNDTVLEQKQEIEQEEDFVTDFNNPETVLESNLGTVEYFKGQLVDNGYILVNDAAANRVYVMGKTAEVIYEWDLKNKVIGNDAYLLSDGNLLAMIASEDPKIKFGGQAGIVQLLDKNAGEIWSFEYSTDDHVSHHDAELLPNGNIIFQTWERKTAATAKAAGSMMDIDVFPDAIVEVDPSTNEIVWEWHAWDHLIQDYDSNALNFGSIADNPQLIDLNYVLDEQGDIMHGNGLAYDAENDLIFLSVNFFSEVWVIDHSTTTEQAASNAGGNYDKGGNLVYRFGNPEAYDNALGTRLFDHNHYPNLLTGEDKGNMLIFSNGFTKEQSTAYELKLPNPLVLEPNRNNEPTVVWSFTHDTLFSPKVSGVEKLSNGNRLITEGDAGFWEVTEKGQVVWRFKGEGFFWRAYHYPKDATGIKKLGL